MDRKSGPWVHSSVSLTVTQCCVSLVASLVSTLT